MAAPTLRLDDEDSKVAGSPSVVPGKPVLRLDRAILGPSRRTEEGYLQFPGSKIAKVGTQLYQLVGGGSRVELRLPEQVFAPDSLATGELKPLVLDHPPEGRVDAKNFQRHVRGVMSNLRQDGEFIVADITVMDEKAAQAIESGVSELSAAYYCVDQPIPGGVFRQDGHPMDGIKADYSQVAIRYNHLALVPSARANTGLPDRPVRLRLDSAGQAVLDSRSRNAMKLTVNGVEEEVSDNVAGELIKLQTENKLIREFAKMGSPAGAPAPKMDAKAMPAAQAPAAPGAPAGEQEAPKQDSAEVKVEPKKEELDAEAKAKADAARHKLVTTGVEVAGLELEAALRMDSADIQVAVLKKLDPKFDESVVKTKPAGYLEAALEFALREEALRVDSAAALAKASGASRLQATGSTQVESPYLKAAAEARDRLTKKTAQA